MKFQVTKKLCCNSTGAAWTIIELSDSTPVNMGTVEKRGDDIIAYTKVDQSIYDPGVEAMTSRALYNAMWMICDHEKQENWRKDFGQI